MDVANPETGEEAPIEKKEKGSFIKHLASFAAGATAGSFLSNLGEEADAVTSSSDIATVNTVLTKTRKRK